MEEGKVIPVTDANFEEIVLKSEIPVLVAFWAPWCGPYRMLAPVLDQLAQEYSGRVLIAKLNTDENPGVYAKYGIRSLPESLIFKNGEVTDKIVGSAPKSNFKQKLDAALA